MGDKRHHERIAVDVELEVRSRVLLRQRRILCACDISHDGVFLTGGGKLSLPGGTNS